MVTSAIENPYVLRLSVLVRLLDQDLLICASVMVGGAPRKPHQYDCYDDQRKHYKITGAAAAQ
jgi:hypothetical protein